MGRVFRIVAIAIIAIVLAGTAVRHNISNVALRTNPALADRAAPANGMALDRQVELQLSNAMEMQQTSFPDATLATARSALAAEPFAISSLAALALDARGKGDVARADQLLDQAGALSRREVRVQLMLIERSARRFELDTLMEQIDGTLRVFQSTYPTIFPILTQFLIEPRLLQRLEETAEEDPEWFRLFVGEALASPQALTPLRDLLMAQPQSAAATDTQIRRNLIAQLVNTGQIADARSYFLSLHPDEQGRPIIDPEFENPDFEAPMGWLPGDSPDLTADFLLDEGLGLFAARGREGVAAMQVTSLAPGRYAVRFAGDSESLALTYLDMECVTGPDLLVNSGPDNGRFVFTVPDGCEHQRMGLAIRESNDIGGTEAYIRGLEIAQLTN